MHTTKYLIVGAGMTGDMAAKGIREHDIDGSITMIGGDPHPTYKRPLLTKGLWQGAPEEKLWRDLAEGVELVGLVKELLEGGHADHGARLDDGNRLAQLAVPVAEGEGAALEAVEFEVRRQHVGPQDGRVGGAGARHGLAQGAERGPARVVLGAHG